MNYKKTVYKIDSKGKTRVLTVSVNDSIVKQEYGILGGNLVTNSYEAKPKNIGKSNATTANEQAISEAMSIIEKKLKKDYFETLEEVKNKAKQQILPMLAKSYDDHSSKIDWDDFVYAQPKLDGQRCLVIVNDDKITLLSRQGRIIDTVTHIIKELEEKLLPLKYNGLVLDGELYCHGLSFQENMKLIKKYREGETEQVKLHVYDRYAETVFTDRYTYIKVLFNQVKFDTLVLLETRKISSESELKEVHSEFLGEGYEGTIIRHGRKFYKNNGRCDSLLKYKDFHDIAVSIVDIVPSEKRPDQAVLECEYEGKRFRASLKMSHDERIEILSNKEDYINQTAEIRFFEYTDDGVPRFPVCVGFRNDK